MNTPPDGLWAVLSVVAVVLGVALVIWFIWAWLFFPHRVQTKLASMEELLEEIKNIQNKQLEVQKLARPTLPPSAPASRP